MSLIRKNFLIGIIALTLGIVVSLPHLFGIYKYGRHYSPLKITSDIQYTLDETYLYAAQTRQISAGHFFGDAYTWEHRNNLTPFLGEIGSIIPLSLLSILFGSTEVAFIVSDIIFPIILFLLIFSFTRKLGYTIFISTLSAIAAIIVPYTSSLLPNIAKEGTQLTGNFSDSLFLARTPHPQISLIYLFASLFITAFILTKPVKRLVFLWAITIGLSIYSSVFVGSTIIFGTVLAMPLLFKKVPKRLTITAGLIILAFALPYIINSISLRDYLIQSDFLKRTTYPVSILFPRQLRYIVFALVLLKFTKSNLSKILLIYILAASIISDGHQIILGRAIDADHWINRVISPLSTFSLILILDVILKKVNINKNILYAVLIVVIVSIGVKKQISWSLQNESKLAVNPQLEELIILIDKETQKSDVLGSSIPELSQNFTGLTGRRTYLGPADRILADSQERFTRACDLLIISKNKDIENIKKLSEYQTGLLVWQKYTSPQKNDATNSLLACVNQDLFSNSYKLNYFISMDKKTLQYKLVKINN